MFYVDTHMLMVNVVNWSNISNQIKSTLFIEHFSYMDM